MFDEVSIDLITEPKLHCAVLLAEWRGDTTQAMELMEKMVARASSRGEGMALTHVEYCKAVLYNGLAE